MHKLEEQEVNVKSYAGEKIPQIMKKTMVEFVSLFSLFRSDPSDVKWCPSVALGSLFQATNNPVCGCLFPLLI